LSYSFRRIVNPTEQDLLTENLKNFESALLTTDEVLLKIFEDNERAFKKANTQVESFKNSLEVINQNTRGDLILGNRYVGMGRTLMSGDLSVYEDTEEALAKAEVKREEVLTKNQDAFNNYILRLSQIAVDLVKSNQISVDRADKIITEQVSKVNEIINKRQFEGTEAINLAVDVELLPSYRINSEQSNVKEIIKEETTDIAQLLQDGVNLINVTIDAAFEGITGKKLFDAQKMKEDAESAFRELNESVENSIRPLKEQLEELNKELKINLELDENQISSIESQIETLNNQILEMDRQRALAQVEIMADAYGRIAVLREEELKGAQLTEQEKVEAYKKGALAHIEAVNEAANNEINQQIATLQAVIDGCNQKIAQFASLAAAALMAGNAESYALNAKLLTGQVTELGEANAKLAEFQTQLAENNKKAEEAKNKILSFTGGGGIGGGRGGGGGGGSAKSAQDESLELAKVAAERAKWEAEEAAKDIAAAFKRGEVSINDYLQKALAARKEMYNADIAAAQEAVSKAEGAAAQAKAQLALDKALKGGAENTKEAYEEVFRAIEEAYNELIERLNGQSEAIRLKVDMGELTEAQGRDELKRAIEAAEPSLQNMITGMEELQAAAQAAGLDMDFTGPIARAETALWNLKAPLNEIARNINGMIGNAIEGLLTDIASGTMSLGDALRNFLSNIAKGLAEIAAQQIVASIMGAMGGPTGGIGGFISSIFGAFAEGGKVTGPGTGTSDSVLARLSNGEYVIRAKAVDYWGASFLEQINKMRAFNPKKILPKYAEGGPVGYIRNEVESYATTTNNLTKYLESRQESVFVDVKVKAEADKDRLIKMIVGDPSFTKGVMKTNKREAKSLTAILG
jgi:hypothetical protein